MRRSGMWLCGLAAVSGLSGCAIFDPYQVWRYHADYNSERACSAQIVFYDHLPPKPVRTRLVQWGYNVAPGGPATIWSLPGDGSLAPAPAPNLPLPPDPAAPAMIPLAPPTDLLDQSRPPEFTTPGGSSPLPDGNSAPPSSVPRGPTAAQPPSIQRSGYAIPTSPRIASSTSRTWLFK